MRQQRARFRGMVLITSKGEYLMRADVTLIGYVEMIEIPTLNGSLTMDGVTSWTGFINSTSKPSLSLLLGKRLELHFPQGDVASCHIEDLRIGTILGCGLTPF